MTNFSDMLSKAKDMQDKMKEAQEKIKERSSRRVEARSRQLTSSCAVSLATYGTARGRSQDALPATSRCDRGAPSCTTCTRSAGEHEKFKPARRLLVNEATLVGGV